MAQCDSRQVLLSVTLRTHQDTAWLSHSMKAARRSSCRESRFAIVAKSDRQCCSRWHAQDCQYPSGMHCWAHPMGVHSANVGPQQLAAFPFNRRGDASSYMQYCKRCLLRRLRRRSLQERAPKVGYVMASVARGRKHTREYIQHLESVFVWLCSVICECGPFIFSAAQVHRCEKRQKQCAPAILTTESNHFQFIAADVMLA